MKTAIFGGSFDPIHRGHVNLALTALNELDLDSLIFVPNYISPFKTDKKVTRGDIRAEMIEAILHYDERFRISRYEIGRAEPSYTYDTLNHFRKELGADIYFVLGFDSFIDIDTWYRGEEIIRDYKLITGMRPNTDYDEAYSELRRFERDYGGDITMLHIEPFDAASSEIRDMVRQGLDISAYVLPEVEDYIRKNGLYTD
jgi:nicotinate-nucleotide adenylyltransferase